MGRTRVRFDEKCVVRRWGGGGGGGVCDGTGDGFSFSLESLCSVRT